uniref:Uncharacterized protein n=1 Tax=Setaria digitata TaxID=48799 RepID=A0A915PZD8_9BILA
MSNDGGLLSPNTPSDTDSNSNSGSLFSRQYPDELSSSSSESKENTPTLLNNENMTSQNLSPNVKETFSSSKRQIFKIFPETLKCQPKITREDSIDLATDEASFHSKFNQNYLVEKANSDDEWFMGKFRLTHKSQLLDWDKEFESRKYPFRTRRTFVQTCLIKRLAEIRKLGQLKRKAMYDADNDIADDESSSVGIDACELTDDEENKITTLTSEGEPENDITMEESEKDRSGSDGSEAVAQENEDVNDEEIDLHDKHSAGDKEIGSIKLTENRNGIATSDNDEEFDSEASGDASDEDWRKNWFRLGMKTCETPMKHSDHESCYMPDCETGSSSLSDEAADEDGRSSASIVDDLLNDVAANCSGIFDYPEDYEPKEQNSSKRVSICKDADDTDDKDEDELIRRRKPKTHRLVFEDSSDEDELTGDGWKSGNIRGHEAHSKQCTEAKISVYTSEKSNFDDPDALLAGKHKFNDNNDKDFLFNEGNDGHKESVMQPTGRVIGDEKYQQNELMEEGDSSDEEMEVFRKLQNMRKSKKCEYVEEEASLSGDDVGSDEDDDDQLDVYEAEEGDNDELPDNETIREELQKQWLKQQQDEEDRKLLYWKDQLLIDGDLSRETDRTFRFKLRCTTTENVNEKTDHIAASVETDEVDGEELWKKHREISKWKREVAKVGLHDEDILMKGTNPLLQAASKIIDKSESSQSQEQTSSPLCKNSLLSHRKSLSQVLNQTKITLYTASASANGHIEVPCYQVSLLKTVGYRPLGTERFKVSYRKIATEP